MERLESLAFSGEARQIRVQRCRELLHSLAKDLTLANRLMFSDESHFHVDGYVNSQNCRYWDTNKPEVFDEHSLHPEKVTVWAAIGKEGVIGPVFNSVGAKGTVTSESYLQLLQTVLYRRLSWKSIFRLSYQMLKQRESALPWSLCKMGRPLTTPRKFGDG